MRFVWLHGFASAPTSTKARYVQERLARRGQTLEVPDLNEPAFRDLTVTRMLDQLAKISGQDRLVLFGSSLGGYAAATYAARHPDQIAAAVLLAPAFDLARRWEERMPRADLRRWRREGVFAFDHYAHGRKEELSIEFLGDAAKGAAATAAGRAVGGPQLALACGVSAMLGHVFPLFRGFRGGRGVATAAGTVAVVEPVVALPLAAAWFLIARVTGRASVASLVVIGATPVTVVALDRPAWEKVGMAALAAIVVGRHAGNLVRLARGDEPTLERSP